MSFRSTATMGTAVSPEQVARIEPGRTRLGEILASLGPPDFVIDGTQRVPEGRSRLAGYVAEEVGRYWIEPVRFRVLSSPEGTVCLVYQRIELTSTTRLAGMYLYSIHGDIVATTDELFVYVSKASLTVVETAMGSRRD